MPPGVTEDFDKQVRAAIDYLRRVIEVRRRIDHAEQLDDEVDTVERTERVAHGSNKSKSDEPGAPVAFLDADLGTKLTGQCCSLVVARTLAGEEQEVACKPVG